MTHRPSVSRPTHSHDDYDALGQLRQQLRDLHLGVGAPSTRQIAARTDGKISHTTVNNVLRCVRLPRWGHLELVLEALGGDVEAFRQAWIAVRSPTDQEIGPGNTTHRQDELDALRAEVVQLRQERDDLLDRVVQRARVVDYAVSGRRLAGHPTALRILLGTQLRRLREARGISRAAAAWEIRASEMKIGRLEAGRISITERDFADLLTLYGVASPDDRTVLLTLMHQSDYSGWWHRYGDSLPAWFKSFVDIEGAASLIRTYETHFVPGLLQTADYAREIMCRGHPGASDAEIERRVQVRMARKELLARSDPPLLWAVIDETVLRRPPVSPDVMGGQIEALINATKLPNVRLQLNATPSIASTVSFMIFRFPDNELPDVIYIEHLAGALYMDAQEDIDQYSSSMERLAIDAESPRRSVELLEMYLEDLAGADKRESH
jgi:transcriptional regulator with XRE-family HTH domain